MHSPYLLLTNGLLIFGEENLTTTNYEYFKIKNTWFVFQWKIKQDNVGDLSRISPPVQPRPKTKWKLKKTLHLQKVIQCRNR